MKNIIKSTLLVMMIFVSCKKDDVKTKEYKVPYSADSILNKPVLFKIPGLKNESFHITFTPKGDTFFFMGHNGVMACYYIDNKWTEAISASFNSICAETPMISPDGHKLFFTGSSTYQNDNDIWVLDNTINGWSNPRNLGQEVNSSSFESGPSVASNGNLYFRSARNGGLKLFCSKFVNKQYIKPEPLSENINKFQTGEPFISPDESYILFSIQGNGVEFLYISFNTNNKWTDPKSVGPKINAGGGYIGRPWVSPNGSYLFFTKGNDYSSWRIYQIDWKPVLDSLKKLNNL